MEEWLRKELSKLLDSPIEKEVSEYIMKIENERDLESYFATLLDNTNSQHKQFIIELKRRRAIRNNQAGCKKINDNQNIPNKHNKKKRGKEKGKENILTQAQVQIEEPAKAEKIEKKKTKFTNLYSHGDVLLKGRHKCDCEAKRHELINNCLNCGRIVCIQEGSGPCFFCKELVCSPEEHAILQSTSKQAGILYNKLMDVNRKPNKSLEDSIKQRDKLIEYDRNSACRTKVIDDESDYYQSNLSWLSPAERKKLEKKKEEILARKHASRLNRRVNIDLTGNIVTNDDELIDDQSFHFEELGAGTASYDDFENPNICPTIEFDRPTFIEMGILRTNKRVGSLVWQDVESRIQDKEYLEMSDQGLCLSLRQPYASLLVAGIKTHEGRTWYSPHRGRLWIASAAKTPSSDEIANLQHSYRILKNENIKFPEVYPTSHLLGCVTVTDVLSQEEYMKLYPEGECESPYVFICENCYVLPMQLPIIGKNKIYKLDKKLHQAASKLLEKAMKMTK